MIKLDNSIDLMINDLILMSNEVIAMHQMMIEVINKHDQNKALLVIEHDKVVNNFEAMINNQAMTILALLAPVAKDLRTVISCIKIASELERIGDYAKNNAIFMLKKAYNHEMVIEYATKMELVVIKMLEDIMKAFLSRDSELALKLVDCDLEVDTLYRQLQSSIKKDVIEYSIDIIDISLLLKNIERAGDHIVNICEHILFMINGTYYDFA